MVYTIKISDDDDNEVTLSPNAIFRRTVDTSKGYEIIDRPAQQKPKVIDLLQVNNILEIQTTFKKRRDDYDLLFKTMISERTRGTEFTLTIERKTGENEVYKVIPYPRAVDARDPGTGEMDNVTISFLEIESIGTGGD